MSSSVIYVQIIRWCLPEILRYCVITVTYFVEIFHLRHIQTFYIILRSPQTLVLG